MDFFIEEISTQRNNLLKEGKDSESVEARVHDEDVWLTQKSMARLFDCSTDNISLHLKNIFASGELSAEAVTEESSATASDGKKQDEIL